MSKAEDMGVSPSNSQTEGISSNGQSKSGKTLNFGAECANGESSGNKHELDTKILNNEPGETIATISSHDRDEKCANGESSGNKHGLDTKVLNNDPGETIATISSHDKDEKCANGESSGKKHELDTKVLNNEPSETIATISTHDKLPLIEKDASDKHLERPTDEDTIKSSHVGEHLCFEKSESEKNIETGCGSQSCELSENFQKPLPELVKNKLVETSTTVSGSLSGEQFRAPADLLDKSFPIEHIPLATEDSINLPSTKHSGPASEHGAENSSSNQCGTPAKSSANCRRASKSLKKKYVRSSVASSDRVLRTRSEEKPKALEPSQLANDGPGREADDSGKIKKNRKKKKMEKKVADEYSKIRAQVRYFLNRINYEQSLISAYSGDGWKGLSLDKLKPEKELQRATSEILRRKLKIRDLFERLDSLCAEGRLPESLFDSDGEIDSDDIFCAKCGSEDLSLENDIILCDGFCDRGFHQFCLEPPLRKEDIPPGDEGWLCPACDCKADCLDLLNESLGTDLSITDTWEKVFPEATSGDNQDPNFGLPSDDSDDNDYEPEGPESDKKDQEDESRSDNSDSSDFTSASDEMGTLPNDEQFLGLPSDDSEDDDYDPDAPDINKPDINNSMMQESSSSDSKSDSDDADEDVDAALINDVFSGKEGPSLKSHLVDTLESNPGQCTSAAKRSVERLDYKKLYDEEYGDATSHSSEDDDWTETGGPRKRQKKSGEVGVVSLNGNDLVGNSGANAKENTSKGKAWGKKNSKDSNPTAKSHESSPKPCSDGNKPRMLGERATQRLYEIFKENQYPDRSTKTNLAKELDLTFTQVNKWFMNSRWSFNHSHRMNADLDKSTPPKKTILPQTNGSPVVLGLRAHKGNSSCNGAQNENGPEGDTKSCSINANQGITGQDSTTRSSRNKRKGKMGDQALNPDSKNEIDPDNLTKDQVMRTSNRNLTKRRKSVP